jgi:hypothetical protein
MGWFPDDYEEFDELRFEDVGPSRRATNAKHRRSTKAGGRKHKKQMSRDRWDAARWDEVDDFDDYNEFEFDARYRPTVDH